MVYAVRADFQNRIGFCKRIVLMYFSCVRQEKYQKKATQGDIPKRHVPLRNPCARIAARLPKMSRFSVGYHEKNLQLLSWRCSKIGTFLNTGRRCGGGFQRGRIFVAPLWLASFGSFLASQEKNISPPSFLYKKIYVFVRSTLFPFPKAGTFYILYPPSAGFPGAWPVRIR